jgi:thiol:disulfide interchange protein DsbD
VGPILIALLTFVAQSGNLILGFFLLFAYALGIGVLFILIGTFTGALTALPGAGAWMNTIKKFFGILLISGALIFLKPLLPLNFYYLLWGMVLIAVGVFIGGLDAVDRDTTNLKRWCKVLGILALISGAVILISGLKSSLISPSQSTGLIVNKTERTGISWKLNDVDGAFKLANEQEAKVVMDFYADWCSACRELDEKTWSNPELASKFNKWIFLKIDLTRPDLEMMKVQKKYRIQGLPTVIFLNENEQELGRFSGFKSASEVMQIMTNL